MNRRYYRIFYGSRFCGYYFVQLPGIYQKSLQYILCVMVRQVRNTTIIQDLCGIRIYRGI